VVFYPHLGNEYLLPGIAIEKTPLGICLPGHFDYGSSVASKLTTALGHGYERQAESR
jgi:hypothetical protein